MERPSKAFKSLLAIVLILCAAIPVALGARLRGYPGRIYYSLSVTAGTTIPGTAYIVVYSANGNVCGRANLINTSTNAQQIEAYRTNMDNLIAQVPGTAPHLGVWFTDETPQLQLCPGTITGGNLRSFYLRR